MHKYSDWRALVLAAGAMVGTLSQAAPAAASCAEPSATPTAAVVVLLDRSGSMVYDGQCLDGNVKRKWECAVDDAQGWISDNDPYEERVYFVWQFRTMGDPSVVTVQDNGAGSNGYCLDDMWNKLAPDGEVENTGPEIDDASTPLAGAYCEAVSYLLAYRQRINNPDLPLFIKLESDGLENSTPVENPCQGDTGGTTAFSPANPVLIDTSATPATADGLVIGSWEANMYDAAISGSAHNFPPLDAAAFQRVPAFPTDLAVITNITFLNEFIPPAGLMASRTALARSGGVDAATASGPAVRTSSSLAAASALTDLVGFFGKLASVSGGRLIEYGSGEPVVGGSPYSYHVVPGDADDNGCVNSADFALVQATQGQLAIASNPNAIRSDLNADGIVNSGDYLVLSDNYGSGCSTPPGSVPVLKNALLGFEDPSQWSSVTPLSFTGVKKSEGEASLKVAGKNWREIKSVNFNTSVFSGVTTRIAFDVLTPPSPSNPAWVGQVLLFVNAPSAGIHNLSLGSVELTGKPLNKFNQATFNLPTAVRNAMRTPRSDFSFRIAVNANDPGYQLDNIRFVP